MSNQKKIVVVAGNMTQFKYWLRNTIVPVTHKSDVQRLHGLQIEKVYFEGNYYESLDTESLEKIKYIIANKVK